MKYSSTICVHFMWVYMTVFGRSIVETSDQCHRDSTTRISVVVLFDESDYSLCAGINCSKGSGKVYANRLYSAHSDLVYSLVIVMYRHPTGSRSYVLSQINPNLVVRGLRVSSRRSVKDQRSEVCT